LHVSSAVLTRSYFNEMKLKLKGLVLFLLDLSSAVLTRSYFNEMKLRLKGLVLFLLDLLT